MIYIEKIRRRRGAAIEMAIVLLLLFSMLSAALVSVSLVLHKCQTSAADELTKRVELDGIAERFIVAVTNNEDLTAFCDTVTEYDVFVSEKENNGDFIVTLTVEEDEEILLTVVLRRDGDICTVIKWTYE